MSKREQQHSENLVGQRFGRLLVIARSESALQYAGRMRRVWICQCACGNRKDVATNDLTRLDGKGTKSCGCIRKQREFVYRRPASLPPGSHPFVREIVAEMVRQRATLKDVERRSGVEGEAVRRWALGKRGPMLQNIEAVVQALGGRLQIKWGVE